MNDTNMHTTDPVCGMRVEPGKEAGRATHDGATYLFCSKHCLSTFNADPARYAKPAESKHAGHAHHAPKPAAAPAGAQYTCPMHPEILKDAPGDCPICGMALVPVGAAAAQEDNAELRDHTRRMWVGVVLSIYYYFGWIKAAFFETWTPPAEGAPVRPARTPVGVVAGVTLGVLALGSVAFGFYQGPFGQWLTLR